MIYEFVTCQLIKCKNAFRHYVHSKLLYYKICKYQFILGFKDLQWQVLGFESQQWFQSASELGSCIMHILKFELFTYNSNSVLIVIYGQSPCKLVKHSGSSECGRGIPIQTLSGRVCKIQILCFYNYILLLSGVVKSTPLQKAGKLIYRQRPNLEENSPVHEVCEW